METIKPNDVPLQISRLILDLENKSVNISLANFDKLYPPEIPLPSSVIPDTTEAILLRQQIKDSDRRTFTISGTGALELIRDLNIPSSELSVFARVLKYLNDQELLTGPIVPTPDTEVTVPNNEPLNLSNSNIVPSLPNSSINYPPTDNLVIIPNLPGSTRTE